MIIKNINKKMKKKINLVGLNCEVQYSTENSVDWKKTLKILQSININIL
jgi:hypothetical protein